MLKIISTYTITQYINKGEYGKVYKAINHETNEHVAIKMISLEKFMNNSKLIQLTKQQTEILSKFQSNENIIKLKEIIKSNRFLYMVYEYCEGGTLEQCLQRSNRLSERQAVKLFAQLISAYKSLHESNIVHRDIKTDNIFFKQGKLKLADFGFSKKLKYEDDLMQTSLGSPLYMAPEVLNNDVYGSKADLWSCGVILYQMLFGKVPYGTCNISQLLQIYAQKQQLPFPLQQQFLSPTIVTMLRRMLTKDQFRRISWEEFFYEYEFSTGGEIRHREKDFEYDLMKLMKRNSSGKESEGERKEGCIKSCKFDWSKITDINSSVHSEQCQQQTREPAYHKANHHHQQANLFHSARLISSHNSSSNLYYSSSHSIPSNQQQIASLYQLKKTIRHFEDEHTKIYELLVIIESMLQSKKDHESDLRVVYFLAYNLEQLLSRNIADVKNYIKGNNELLQSIPEERTKMERLQRIFEKQHEDNLLKINSIKTTIITLDDVGQQILRYPNKTVLRTVIKEFVDNYELQVDEILSLTNVSNKEDAVRLLKILWAVQLICPEKSTSNAIGSQTSININPHKGQAAFKYSRNLTQISSCFNQQVLDKVGDLIKKISER